MEVQIIMKWEQHPLIRNIATYELLCRERKQKADQLSKGGLQLALGTGHRWEMEEDT